ncbi:energy-coupling factor ABC transporter ATP-binding protein [Undibacterium arcticum]|uniref:Energy-coupling factor ABC transporter ATP-binding protein n=1 Tax=Undibacterium arcticum TaxID=1762892 RepID=A0ABV7F9A6_9BURK
MTPLLAIRGLRKQFGARALLDIDALDIGPASAYALTGINGAGKSTLLRILAGLEPAHCAHLSFMGQAMPLTPYPPALRAAIVYVHQHPAMFATSVADNIGYGLRARGVARNDRQRQVEEAMAWAGVSHLRERKTQTLSGGEKQRIALARARILKPRLLLLDEPSSNLDGAAREQVIALIPSLIAQGSSVVMACHDRDLIALPAVQRLKLMDGRLAAR